MKTREQVEHKIELLREFGATELGIDAIMIGGSVGRGTYDILSDIDFFLLIEDYIAKEFLNTGMRTAAEILGHVLLFHGPIQAGKFANSFSALYLDGSRCSFNVHIKSRFELNYMAALPSRIVIDKSGALTQAISSASTLKIDKEQLREVIFNAFWLRADSVSRDLAKGQLWLALFHLADLQNHLLSYIRLIRGLPPRGLNYMRAAKAFEDDFGREYAQILGLRLTASYSLPSLQHSLAECCKEFLQQIKLDLLDREDSKDQRIDRALSVLEQVNSRLALLERE